MTKAVSLGVLLVSLLVSAPVTAQDASSAPSAPAPPAAASQPAPDQAAIAAWQGVISAQILAFRTHDAPGALKFASAEFHKTFTDPEQFYRAIIGSGYQPIADSRDESFGPYELVAADTVIQDVKLTGTDQTVYEAIYQLIREPDGWRVAGVQLMKTQAIGV